MFLAFRARSPACAAGRPRPAGRWRRRSRRPARRGARRHQRPHVLDGDELLEELLVEVGREADEDGPGLVLGGVIVHHQQHLVGPVSVARHGIGKRALDHGRDEDLITDAGRLDDDPVFEPAAEPAAHRGDHLTLRGPAPRDAPRHGRPAHGMRPVRRAIPVTASPSASAMCEGCGTLARPRRVCTARCTWALPAAPLPVIARFTSDGVRARTGAPRAGARRGR